jgi:hypothetical protein
MLVDVVYSGKAPGKTFVIGIHTRLKKFVSILIKVNLDGIKRTLYTFFTSP